MDAATGQKAAERRTTLAGRRHPWLACPIISRQTSTVSYRDQAIDGVAWGFWVSARNWDRKCRWHLRRESHVWGIPWLAVKHGHHDQTAGGKAHGWRQEWGRGRGSRCKERWEGRRWDPICSTEVSIRCWRAVLLGSSGRHHIPNWIDQDLLHLESDRWLSELTLMTDQTYSDVGMLDDTFADLDSRPERDTSILSSVPHS